MIGLMSNKRVARMEFMLLCQKFQMCLEVIMTIGPDEVVVHESCQRLMQIPLQGRVNLVHTFLLCHRKYLFSALDSGMSMKCSERIINGELTL